jgi:predicted DNA-binding transcriptional regulator AlpA
MTQNLLTVPEAAKLLGLSESSLWTLIRTRKIATIAIPSARGTQRAMRRIEWAEISAFIERNRVASSPA